MNILFNINMQGGGEQGQSTTTKIDQIVVDDSGNNNVATTTSLMSPNREVISIDNSAKELVVASSSLPSLTMYFSSPFCLLA